ncbi:hypothetical protein [Pseudomonas plecoglossicida]|uniref:hypothetical protein n=1 Tax=Pseudomonas plecoglossicida TaxID=70775 RepID=UPI00051D314B|nr:hypothetical protein [Pseudomonas plecoglossicida]KGK24485.1 hypothetical protein GT93_06340 [Pseudomonas plecoglossicida]
MIGYQVTTTPGDDTTAIAVKTTDTQELVCHCTIHHLGGTEVVYPVVVMTMAPKHRQSLPDLKLQLLDHLLHQHRAILLSAGNETTGGRFSFQTHLEYAMSHGYNAYQLAGNRITRFDDKDLQTALARPWGEPLPLVLVSKHELPLDAAYDIPTDLVHSLDKLDARAALGG